MRRSGSLAVMLVLLAGTAAAVDPFGVDARLTRRGTNTVVEVAFRVPPGHYLYADTLSANLKAEPHPLRLLDRPQPVSHRDPFSGSVRDSYTNDFTSAYLAAEPGPAGVVVQVHYQGCSEKLCFFPETRTFQLAAGMRAPETERSPLTAGGAPGWRDVSADFDVVGRTFGYFNTGEFLAFLDASEGRPSSQSKPAEGTWARIRNGVALFGADPVEFLRRFGAWWTVLVILMGGLLLNLTPCVLPMIPVNLAILGTGTQGASHAKGFVLGGIYGLGMALVYGALGLVAVLTGAQFGTLNSMPGFNLAIAILFVILGLAMFDVITIDLTRFQGGATRGPAFKRGSYAAALTMGSVAALLAGACVAPVVIAVLILSGNLYAQGAVIGLVLPFMLGVGMALPWPLAGGGLARLPKPGAWMNWVKYGFGVFILLLAFYYAGLAYRGWKGPGVPGTPVEGSLQVSPERAEDWAKVLAEAQAQGVPVFVDFWATWCKNCEAMEATTFRSEAVRQRLATYRVVKFQAEKPNDPVTKDILDYYEVKGLPTYIILKPRRMEAK